MFLHRGCFLCSFLYLFCLLFAQHQVKARKNSLNDVKVELRKVKLWILFSYLQYGSPNLFWKKVELCESRITDIRIIRNGPVYWYQSLTKCPFLNSFFNSQFYTQTLTPQYNFFQTNDTSPIPTNIHFINKWQLGCAVAGMYGFCCVNSGVSVRWNYTRGEMGGA